VAGRGGSLTRCGADDYPVSEGHRVVGVDHLGFGRSAVPDGAEHYTVERHSHRLATLLDSCALRDVTLVVHEWGAPSACRGDPAAREFYADWDRVAPAPSPRASAGRT